MTETPNVPPPAGPASGTAEEGPVYEAGSFWERRLASRFDLTGVGFRGIGRPFNQALYRQREIVLGRALNAARIEPRGSTVVELGPGTGYWVAYWKARGVVGLVGLDITTVATDRLATAFPEYTFEKADISERWPVADDWADMVTAFDVLFHITDDGRFRQAMEQAARVVRPGGHLIVTDLFPHRTSYRGFHQASRTLGEYTRLLDELGFDVVRRLPVFVTMHPPIDLPRIVAPLGSRWWAWIERLLIAEPRRGWRMGRWLGRVDRGLTKVMTGGPTTEMLVARRRTPPPAAEPGRTDQG